MTAGRHKLSTILNKSFKKHDADYLEGEDREAHLLNDLIETQQNCITSTGGLKQQLISCLNSKDLSTGFLFAPNGKPAVFMI